MTPAEKTRLLAERVMGWGLNLGDSWTPLTDLSDAGEVLEAMIAKGWTYDAHDILYGHKVKLSKGRMVARGTGATLPTAICHAALLAEGVKGEEL